MSFEEELKRFKKLGEPKYYASLKSRYPGLSKKQLQDIISKLKESKWMYIEE